MGYHVLLSDNCTMAESTSFNFQAFKFFSSLSTFTNITGLNKSTCYIFGVRAYTVKGHGDWKLITNETLEFPSFPTVTITYTITSTPVITTTDGNIAVIAMSALGVMLIIITFSIVIIICLIIRIKSMSRKCARSDDDIAMQVCELYKARISEENIDQVYDECQMSPDPIYETLTQ
ncbi:PREDICTED: uncharacterized protein LOC109584723 [Amphimedon queenslandica]|uniref:Fibronectin type-III domain-containing protein n=1 Tax=Amphimedon queenslandica TaxID=400682 RepID=A0AAN0JGE2_AMPQE|nr:PREDICTED: uncharacterized protein LOC109584723 [Amphimedon queenslandica]|eukprot:XP_019856105.1 PREDICTED: uncharacterized protein LOC109584723 [Amphimedon queenslandica]